MNKNSKLTTFIFLFISLGADLLSKIWAKSNLVPGVKTSAIPGFINFTLTTNTGGAFSFGQNNFWMVTTAASVLSLAIFMWWLKREFKGPALINTERAAIGFLLGGALGNLIDRFSYGRVTDFLDFAFMNFPIFNVADICIDIGIGLLYIALWQNHKKEKAQNE
ncbi:MAG: signal peptidase II [Cyanobacteria bacterium TGS_CYA1]|nr:signal peptidase II [Cyanobacteria bacterium TGS_CYA1]